MDDGLEVIAIHRIQDRWKKNPSMRRLDPGRLRDMTTRITEAIVDTGATPGSMTVAIEEPFVGKQGSSALKQYAVWAVVANLFQGSIGDRLLSVHPNTVKRFVGKGMQRKEDLMREVKRRWGFTHSDHNVCDAYAIARWAAERDG